VERRIYCGLRWWVRDNSSLSKLALSGVVPWSFFSQVFTYLRFVTAQIDHDSRKRKGVFVAAYNLLESGDLSKEEWTRLRETLDWFNEHLPHPPKNFPTGRAIFWFRADAEDCIHQLWEVVYLLREHGQHVEVHKCRHLRNIFYSDQLQVADYPSPDDGKITTQ
jgi:hypothetical protein